MLSHGYSSAQIEDTVTITVRVRVRVEGLLPTTSHSIFYSRVGRQGYG